MENSDKKQKIEVTLNAHKFKNLLDYLRGKVAETRSLKTKYAKGYLDALNDITDEITQNSKNYISAKSIN